MELRCCGNTVSANAIYSIGELEHEHEHERGPVMAAASKPQRDAS